MQILALLAMEQPVTLSADDIRDEKVRVSRMSPLVLCCARSLRRFSLVLQPKSYAFMS